MAARKKTPTAGLQTLKIGSRVRCTDDGVEGRIVWANGASVKIKWDDGEQVTWRRDSLAGRPVDIRDGDEERPATPAALGGPRGGSAGRDARGHPGSVPGGGPRGRTRRRPDGPRGPGVGPGTGRRRGLGRRADRGADPARRGGRGPRGGTAGRGARCTRPSTASRPRRPPSRSGSARRRPSRRRRSSAPWTPPPRVLGETGQSMSCPEMIGAMAAKGYWTSPGGKTPHATLYSAIATRSPRRATRPASPRLGPAGSPGTARPQRAPAPRIAPEAPTTRGFFSSGRASPHGPRTRRGPT